MDSTLLAKFATALDAALHAGSGGPLGDYVQWLAVELCQYDGFPDRLLAAMTEAFALPELRTLPGSWNLIKVVENEWASLSDAQRQAFITALVEMYPALTDETSCLLVAEIVAELHGGDPALKVLRGLRGSIGAMQRASVAHGLEHLAVGSRDSGVVARACATLGSMRDDSEQTVRKEVDGALARLAKRGLPCR